MSIRLVELKDTFIAFMNKTNEAITEINAQITSEQLAKLQTDNKDSIVSAINEILKNSMKVSGGTVEGNLTATGYLSANVVLRVGSNNNGDSIIQLFDDNRNVFKELKWSTDKDELTIEDNYGNHNIVLHENMNIDCSQMNISLQQLSLINAVNGESTLKSGQFVYIPDINRMGYHDGETKGGFVIPNMSDIKTIEQVRISSNDTTPDFLFNKLSAGKGVKLEKINGGSKEQVKIQTGLYPGLVNFWPMDYNNIPLGWIICDGREISRTKYSELFNVLGTSFGKGDGSTTFNLPNYSGRFLFGADYSIASRTSGGEKAHKLTTNELPSHTHTVYGGGNSSGERNKGATYNCNDARAFNTCINHYAASSNREAPVWSTQRNYAAPNVVVASGGNAEHNNMPPYSAGHWIIFSNIFEYINNKPLYYSTGFYDPITQLS